MNNAITKNIKTLVNNNKTAYDVVYNGINHNHRKQIAEFVVGEGVNTIKQFLKTDFSFCGELSLAKRMAIDALQTKLSKVKSKTMVKKTKKKDNKVKGFKRGCCAVAVSSSQRV